MKFLADENINNDILRGVLRRIPDAHFVRVQDTPMSGVDDATLLAFALEHDAILLTHDVNTMRGFYYERLNAGLPVPPLFLVLKQTPISDVIDALELILVASTDADWVGKIEYLPLR